jgi:hypothetical protein
MVGSSGRFGRAGRTPALLKGSTAAEPARATVVSAWAGVAAAGVGTAGVLQMVRGIVGKKPLDVRDGAGNYKLAVLLLFLDFFKEQQQLIWHVPFGFFGFCLLNQFRH